MMKRHALLLCTMVAFLTAAEAQIEYNWQNSKEGWVSASEPNLGCVLVAEPNALAMKAFNQTPVMRSGTLQDDLNLEATTYNRVRVSLKNTTASGNPNARLFVYPPGSNTATCNYNFAVDTMMVDFETYVISLDDAPTNGVLEGPLHASASGLRGALPMAIQSIGSPWLSTAHSDARIHLRVTSVRTLRKKMVHVLIRETHVTTEMTQPQTT